MSGLNAVSGAAVAARHANTPTLIVRSTVCVQAGGNNHPQPVLTPAPVDECGEDSAPIA